MSEGAPSRVAIKFGASLSSAPKKSPRAPPPSALGKRQRNRFNADSESEEEDTSAGKHQSITAFGADGAEIEDDRHHHSRRDHESDDGRRRHRSDRPRDSRPQQNGDKEVDPPDEDKPIKWGLTLTKRSSADREQAPTDGNKERKADDDGDGQEKKPPKTADEEAMDALLGKNGDDADRRRLVHRTEDDAYQEATRDAPDVDKLEVYEDFPVDGFGASLLRGQGWDGQMRGPKIKEVQRRPNQMGLGAKKLKGEEDLGAWNQKSGGRDKRPRLDEYKRDKEKERSRREERHRDSYKRERERDRDRDRDRDRGGSHSHRDRDYR